MHSAEYQTLRTMEDRHWWYAVLHSLVLKEMRARVPVRAQVLDAGCGTGGMMAKLAEWKTTGIDLSATAVSCVRERGLDNVRVASVNKLPFQNASFDAVLSLDVIYHADVEEEHALPEMVRVLRSGGFLIMNVPAFEWLRGAHDKAVCGARRYTAYQMRSLLERCRLELEMIHYWNAWLLLPLVIRRWWHRADTSDLIMPPRWMNALLAMIGRYEARCCRSLSVPAGSSVFAVARKP